MSEASLAGNELGGSAVFDNPTGIHDENAIGDLDRRQAVGNDDSGPAGEDRLECPLDQLL